MSTVLYYNPRSRAATVVAMLEEVGREYALHYVDLAVGQQKTPEVLALNRMGKLPILVDGEAVVSETAAIALYLADRYAPGRLAPALDDPARGPYLRWIVYGPSVIEPGCAANAGKWETRPGSVGWGSYPEMLNTVEAAIGAGPWLLGDRFTMADVAFGATLRFMLLFGMIEARPAFSAYVERLSARPSMQAAAAVQAKVMAEHA